MHRNPVLNLPTGNLILSENIDYTIEDVEKIKQICREHGIETNLFYQSNVCKVHILTLFPMTFLSFLDEFIFCYLVL